MHGLVTSNILDCNATPTFWLAYTTVSSCASDSRCPSTQSAARAIGSSSQQGLRRPPRGGIGSSGP